MSNAIFRSESRGRARSNSWVEGTLSVISTVRAASPTRFGWDANNVPASPSREHPQSAPLIRMPSQDSLDRSLHNTSSESKKVTAAQMIRDLKQSNSRLIEKTAAMEVEFINQLQATSRESEERESVLKKQLREKSKYADEMETHCAKIEEEKRGQAEQLTKLTEESAYSRHTISGLRTQVSQLEEEQEKKLRKDGCDHRDEKKIEEYETAGWETEKNELLADITALKDNIKQRNGAEQEQDNIIGDLQQHVALLTKQLDQKQNEQEQGQDTKFIGDVDETSHVGDDSASSLVLELKKQHAAECLALKQQNSKEMTNLSNQVLEYKEKIAEETAKHQKIQNEAASAEQYRAQEVDDLRVLTDAQEEEIDKLRKGLEEALQEVELREEDLEELRGMAEKAEKAEAEEVNNLFVVTTTQKEEIETLRKKLEDASEEVKMRNEELEKQQNRFVETEHRLANVESKASEGKERQSEDFDRLRTLTAEQAKELDSLRNKLEHSSEELSLSKKELEERNQAEAEAAAESLRQQSQYEKEKNEAENAKETYRQEIEKFQKDLDEATVAFETVRLELESTTGERDKLIAEQQKARSVDGGQKPPLHVKRDDDSDGARSIASDAAEQKCGTLDGEKQTSKNSELVRSTSCDVRGRALSLLRGELMNAIMQDQSVGSSVKGLFKEYIQKSDEQVQEQVQKDLRSAVQDKEAQLEELNQKIEDRDIAMATLVKSSVSLEEHVAAATQEIEALRARDTSYNSYSSEGGGEGVDVIIASAYELLNFKQELAACREREETFSDKLSVYKNRLQEALNENERLYACLEKESMLSRKANVLEDHLEEALRENDLLHSQLLKYIRKAEGKEFGDCPDDEACTDTSFALQFQQRRSAISKLADQVAERDKMVDDLTQELKGVKLNLSGPDSGPSWKEFKQLRKETQVFAAQLIEQDGDIEGLKQALKSSEDRLAAVNKQLDDGKSKLDSGDSKALQDLEAEIKELKEANDVQVEELCTLRKSTIEVEKVREELNTELQSKNQIIKSLKYQITNSGNSVPDITVDEMELEQLREDKESLRSKLAKLEAEAEDCKKKNSKLEQLLYHPNPLAKLETEVEDNKKTISKLEEMLTTKTAPEVASSADNHLLWEAARNEIESNREVVKDLKVKLEEEQEAREEYEKNINELELEKDAAINKLRKQLKEQRTSELEATKKAETESASENDAVIENQRNESSTKQDVVTLHEKMVVVLQEREAQIEALERKLEEKEKELRGSQDGLVEESAKATICKLEHMLAEKNASEAAAYDDEREELLAEIENLQGQLDAAHSDLAFIEGDQDLIGTFKNKLEKADEARDEKEKSIIDNYERKLSLLKLDNDVAIDKLHKELTQVKLSETEQQEELSRKLVSSQIELSNLREHLAGQLQQREAHIYGLERGLQAQEELVCNMRAEMDHLQGNMESTAISRREQLESMQQELTDLTNVGAKQDREIASLKLQLEDSSMVHKTETAKLQGIIKSLEKEASVEDLSSAGIQIGVQVKEVKDRLDNLRKFNAALQEKNVGLQEDNENLRKHVRKAEDLERTLETQTLKVNELEESLREERSWVSQVTKIKYQHTAYATAAANIAAINKKRETIGPVEATSNKEEEVTPAAKEKRNTGKKKMRKMLGLSKRGKSKTSKKDKSASVEVYP